MTDIILTGRLPSLRGVSGLLCHVRQRAESSRLETSLGLDAVKTWWGMREAGIVTVWYSWQRNAFFICQTAKLKEGLKGTFFEVTIFRGHLMDKLVANLEINVQKAIPWSRKAPMNEFFLTGLHRCSALPSLGHRVKSRAHLGGSEALRWPSSHLLGGNSAQYSNWTPY
jgi:hypothetical protein